MGSHSVPVIPALAMLSCVTACLVSSVPAAGPGCETPWMCFFGKFKLTLWWCKIDPDCGKIKAGLRGVFVSLCVQKALHNGAWWGPDSTAVINNRSQTGLKQSKFSPA